MLHLHLVTIVTSSEGTATTIWINKFYAVKIHKLLGVFSHLGTSKFALKVLPSKNFDFNIMDFAGEEKKDWESSALEMTSVKKVWSVILAEFVGTMCFAAMDNISN